MWHAPPSASFGILRYDFVNAVTAADHGRIGGHARHHLLSVAGRALVVVCRRIHVVDGEIGGLADMLAALLRGSMELSLQLLGGQLVRVKVIHIGDRIGRACRKTEVEGLCREGRDVVADSPQRMLATSVMGKSIDLRFPKVVTPELRAKELICVLVMREGASRNCCWSSENGGVERDCWVAEGAVRCVTASSGCFDTRLRWNGVSGD